MKNINNLLKLGLVFCIGGLTDSIIKYHKRKNAALYKIEIRIAEEKGIYDAMCSYICSNASKFTVKEMKIIPGCPSPDVYWILVVSTNKDDIDKIQAEYDRLIGGNEE